MTPKSLLSILLIVVLWAPVAVAKKTASDNELHDIILRKLADDQVVKGGNLDVEVKAGVATVSGSVEFDVQKSRAEKLIKKVGGVKSVVNQITVRHPGMKAPN